MYTRMLKKVPGVTECYGWWNSMAFTKSQTNHFSAHEKTEIPGKPNSNMYPPSLELLQENEDLTQAAILDTCEEGPGALRG